MRKAISNLLPHAGLTLISAPWLYLLYLAIWDGNGMAWAPFIVIFVIATGRLFSA